MERERIPIIMPPCNHAAAPESWTLTFSPKPDPAGVLVFGRIKEDQVMSRKNARHTTEQIVNKLRLIGCYAIPPCAHYTAANSRSRSTSRIGGSPK
jgi:hypothetical protein